MLDAEREEREDVKRTQIGREGCEKDGQEANIHAALPPGPSTPGVVVMGEPRVGPPSSER
jgi:hypothetical protein